MFGFCTLGFKNSLKNLPAITSKSLCAPHKSGRKQSNCAGGPTASTQARSSELQYRTLSALEPRAHKHKF